MLADEEANLAAMHAEILRPARFVDDLSRLAEAERPGLLVGKRTLDLADLARAEAADFESRLHRRLMTTSENRSMPGATPTPTSRRPAQGR